MECFTLTSKTRFRFRLGQMLALCAVLAPVLNAGAFERYSGCASCHGSFTDSTSLKGTIFPGGSKHTMHRSNSYMGTQCNLCHSSNDSNNPYTGRSDGYTGLAGVGCTGCHEPAGLRAHHANSGIAECSECHNDPAPVPESVKPPYYGTAFTKANNPANGVLASNTNENWSVDDFVGLDNDGDGLYDIADFDCGPYKLTSIVREGNNVRISWQTAGGRKDRIQSAPIPGGIYTNVSPAILIPGVGVVVTNYLELNGAATAPRRFYRITSVPNP